METINRAKRSALGGSVLPGTSTLPPMNAEHSTGNQKGVTAKDKKPTRDRFGVLNEFVDCSIGGLTKAELAAWLCLYRDTRNGTASTSQADISRRANLSMRSVGKAIKKLTKCGLVAVVFQGGLNRGPSRYRVHSLRNHGS
jgi:predicted transcriptional regulator